MKKNLNKGIINIKKNFEKRRLRNCFLIPQNNKFLMFIYWLPYVEAKIFVNSYFCNVKPLKRLAEDCSFLYECDEFFLK